MTLPEMTMFVPLHIRQVLEQLEAMESPACKAAADIITAFVQQSQPEHMIRVDLELNIAHRGGVSVALTPNQAVLLHTLIEHHPAVVPVGELFKAVWGPLRTEKNINTIRVMMVNLRKRLLPLKVKVINRPWVGYRLELL